jgi:hypothetical protein
LSATLKLSPPSPFGVPCRSTRILCIEVFPFSSTHKSRLHSAGSLAPVPTPHACTPLLDYRQVRASRLQLLQLATLPQCGPSSGSWRHKSPISGSFRRRGPKPPPRNSARELADLARNIPLIHLLFGFRSCGSYVIEDPTTVSPVLLGHFRHLPGCADLDEEP